jgi:deoxyribonuclease-4
MVRIGAHDREGDPLAVVHATGADIVQFFLGDPQGWDAPTFPGGDAAALRDALAAAGVDAYIHAPYGINVASANNRIRIPSRKLLAQQLEAAASIGAKGLVVHGGHVTGGVADEVGYDNWRKAMERIPRPIPLLIENTAGGDHAMARGVTALARLWDTIGDVRERGRPGRRADRLLPGHLPRLCRRRRARHRGGPGEGDHRPDRPGALQQLAGRVRLRP